MEQIKFSVFDIFAYIIPGSITLFALVVLMTSNAASVVDLLKLLQDISWGSGIALVIAAYIVGFAIDSPGSWLYYSIGYKMFGAPYSHSREKTLSHSQQQSLVRQFSPANHIYIQLWKVIKTMSHNLSFSVLLLALAAAVQAFRSPSFIRGEWVILSVISFLLCPIFLHRAHVFDSWHYEDLWSTIQVLRLEERAPQASLKSKGSSG